MNASAGADERGEREQDRRAAARAAAAQRAGDERRRAERAADRADDDRRPPAPSCRRRGRSRRATTAATTSADRAPAGEGGRGDAERSAEPDEDPDRVPGPHDLECTSPRPQASSRAITASVNCAARAPSTTRWSKVTLMFPIGRTTTSPSRTTGPRPDAVDAEDADLGMVDERRHEEPGELAGARHGERRAAQLRRVELARARPLREPVDVRAQLVEAALRRSRARRARRGPGSVCTAMPRS